MYFGFAGMSQYPFVAVGTAVVLVWSLLLGLVYAVGSARGAVTAMRYFSVVSISGLAALLVTLGWALLTGQWQRFIAQFGWQPMLEMLLLAALLLFTMVWMGMTYLSTRLREEESRDATGEEGRSDA